MMAVIWTTVILLGLLLANTSLVCSHGFHAVNPDCVDNPCMNGGSCISDSIGWGYRCWCAASWFGTRCTQRTSIDKTSPPTTTAPQALNCGGTLDGPSGFIESPNFPDPYPPNSRCTWNIQADVGKRVRLRFHEFATERCSDYITIKGAASTAYQHYGRLPIYCGRIPPRTLLSVNNTLEITFVSDNSVQLSGFYLNFTIVDAEPDCGGILNEPSGFIQSPNFPDSYPPNSRCMWSIQAGVGRRVRLEFHEFLTESRYDCVTIQGAAPTEYYRYYRTYTRTYCGRVSPRTLLSVNNTLNITFNSDESVELSGFYLNFTIVDAEPDCGGTLNGPSGFIQSPNYPDSYPPNSRCVWNIQAGVGKRVRLEFHEFLTAHHDCITIRGAISTDYLNYGRLELFCGRVPPQTLLSVNNTLNITFNSDESQESSGFYLNFTIVDAEPDCGGTLNGSSGFIQSPNFPDSYPPNSRCTWSIQAAVGKRVRLEFHEFLTESRYDCVTVRGVAPTNSHVRWHYRTAIRYCGTVSPHTVFSVSNTLNITFNSDRSLQLSGFYLNFTTVNSGEDRAHRACGGLLNSSSGIILSPNYPSEYPNNVECIWKINADSDRKIRLSFNNFSLESSRNCEFDYVAVIGASTSLYTRNSRYCGEIPSHSIISTNNTMTIRFKSDSSIAANGFNLSYTIGDHGL